VIVLHPVEVDTDLPEPDLVIAFEEETAAVSVDSRRDYQQSLDGRMFDLHVIRFPFCAGSSA
jgi:hypothetical protein